jgi:adenylylsulfate kinase
VTEGMGEGMGSIAGKGPPDSLARGTPCGVNGTIVWFTGLPASGKSTLADRTRDHLKSLGHAAIVLDGDALRVILGAHTYEEGDRDAFYRTLAGLAAAIAHQNMTVLVAATAPRRAHRALARHTGCRFIEVWVQTSQSDCEARDHKGLYARARRGEITTLPGMGAAYEPPEHPDVIAQGGLDDAAVAAIARLVETSRAV